MEASNGAQVPQHGTKAHDQLCPPGSSKQLWLPSCSSDATAGVAQGRRSGSLGNRPAAPVTSVTIRYQQYAPALAALGVPDRAREHGVMTDRLGRPHRYQPGNCSPPTETPQPPVAARLPAAACLLRASPQHAGSSLSTKSRLTLVGQPVSIIVTIR
ncbi:hypothetical protein VTN96DRAFT_9629 [Rasamsonia emersonii]